MKSSFHGCWSGTSGTTRRGGQEPKRILGFYQDDLCIGLTSKRGDLPAARQPLRRYRFQTGMDMRAAIVRVLSRWRSRGIQDAPQARQRTLIQARQKSTSSDVSLAQSEMRSEFVILFRPQAKYHLTDYILCASAVRPHAHPAEARVGGWIALLSNLGLPETKVFRVVMATGWLRRRDNAGQSERCIRSRYGVGLRCSVDANPPAFLGHPQGS